MYFGFKKEIFENVGYLFSASIDLNEKNQNFSAKVVETLEKVTPSSNTSFNRFPYSMERMVLQVLAVYPSSSLALFLLVHARIEEGSIQGAKEVRFETIEE